MSQLVDDQSDIGESPDGPVKTVSKATFGCLSWAIFFVILLIEIALSVTVSRVVGVRYEGGWIGGLGLLNLILSRVVADRILKLMGLSRSGKTVEVRGRTVAFPEGEVADDEVVEVRCPSSFITGLFWMSLLMFLLLAVLITLSPPSGTVMVGLGYLLIAFFGLGAGYCFYERTWGNPQAWADSSGITGYPVGFYFRRRFVPWSRVATCEIETFYDTFGKPVIIRPILKGFDNEALMTLNLLFTKLEEQERLIKYIKAKLPKPKYDDWE
jgi:hypothetical protein